MEIEGKGLDQQCTPCPLNFQTDGPGQTTALACQCIGGLQQEANATGVCGLCGSGKYLDRLANKCLPCPAGSTSAPGSVGILSCTCPVGTREAQHGSSLVCEPCPLNTYSSSAGVACIACPQGMITKSTGSISLSSCQCSPGFIMHAGLCLSSLTGANAISAFSSSS